jgi:hypothetical protein
MRPFEQRLVSQLREAMAAQTTPDDEMHCEEGRSDRQ